ncbi:MAG: hypothetical protein RLZZ265_126 [Verrucomicrobiota bacterium]|jgi:uncharacterized SAM-binding protein YcdF (DUF218 family)
MMDYVLRGVLTLLEPVGFLWAALIVLTALLLRKNERRLAAFAGGLALLIWVIGATPLPGSILATLERPWVGVKRAELPTADAIVLLGGYGAPSREEVGRLHFNGSADRAVVALELVRLEKAKVLIAGGSGFTFEGERFAEADLLKGILDERKLTSAEVISLGGCKNTRHEAEKVAKLAQERGWKRILLVTSATHLRRATAVFRTTTGLEIIPVPSAFVTSASIVTLPSLDLVPRSHGFAKLDAYLHEQIGWLVYRRRGWISAEDAAR